MVLVVKLLNKADYEAREVESLNELDIDDAHLRRALNTVMRLAQSYSQAKDLPIERIAKSREFVEFLLDKIVN
jgi:hypothetical protein